MSNSVARGVEEVEAAIPEVVDSIELADFEGSIGVSGEVDFDEVAAGIVRLENGGIGILGVAREKVGFEAWPNDDLGGRRELSGVTRVIPVPVRPDDGFDGARGRSRDGIRFEDLGDGVLDADFVTRVLEAVGEDRREVLVVFADAEVEEKTACGVIGGGVVFDEEGVGWGTEYLVSLYRWGHESLAKR